MTDPAPPIRDLRAFGVIMLAALGYAAFRAHRRALPVAVSVALVAAGVVVLLLSLVAPAAVRPLYRGWMAIGHGMGRITTPILLGVLFVLVFVPTRMLLAVMGRDPLGMRPARGTATWWVERSRTTFNRDDFERLS